jgi:uncharacterized membrane protein
MEASTLAWTIVLSLMPISELRGAIPFAVAQGVDWPLAYAVAVGVNALVAPLCWIFLSTAHKLFLRISWYRSFFDRFVEKARGKVHEGVEKWGWLGVAVFVAVPLPVTGAWTGTIGAWVLGLSKRKTMAAIVLGVACAGAIVTAVVLLGVGALELFIKRL